jgi:hypothetical protein
MRKPGDASRGSLLLPLLKGLLAVLRLIEGLVDDIRLQDIETVLIKQAKNQRLYSKTSYTIHVSTQPLDEFLMPEDWVTL